MNQPQVCPACQADIDDDLLASTGASECPFCGADLSDVARAPRPTTASDGVFSMSRFDIDGDLELPLKSSVQVVDADGTRLVVHIPPGGANSRGLGCFALFWNGFMCIFTPPWFFVGDANDGPPMLFLIPFLGLFWAVGLGMLYFWVHMRFTRTYLSLERGRLAIQRILFGRKSVKVTHLDADSKAKLVQAYSQNDDPIYKVALNGTNRTATFGTALSKKEKEWFVRVFNMFLGVKASGKSPLGSVPDSCPACGGRLDKVIVDTATGASTCPHCSKNLKINKQVKPNEGKEMIADLAPHDLPSESEIKIIIAEADRLYLKLRAIPLGKVRTFVGAILMLFSLVELGIAGYSAFQKWGEIKNDFDGFAFAFSLVYMLPGLISLMLALIVYFGKITVDLTSDRLKCRWHFGPLGFRKQATTESITRVILVSGMPHIQSRADTSTAKDDSEEKVKVCTVYANKMMFPLTTYHEIQTAREMAGLVRYQLRQMGFEVDF